MNSKFQSFFHLRNDLLGLGGAHVSGMDSIEIIINRFCYACSWAMNLPNGA